MPRARFNRWVGIGLAIAVVAIGIAWLWPQDRARIIAKGKSDLPSEPVRTAVRSTASLPPIERPLRYSLSQLEELANQGLPPAACRLAAEYEVCAEAPAVLQDHDRWLLERRAALPLVAMDGPGAEINIFRASFEAELAQRESLLSQIKEHCIDVEVPSAAARLHRWRQAARMGSRPAIIHYSSGRAFEMGSVLETRGALGAYEREAEPLLLQLAEEGDVEAIALLANAYSPLATHSPSLWAQAVSQDGGKALALFHIARDAVATVDSALGEKIKVDLTRQIDLLVGALPEEEVARGRAILADIASTWAPPSTKYLHESIGTPGRRVTVNPSNCAEHG